MAKDLKWKLISSQYLIRDSWLTARKDTCERPDGKIVDPYYVLEYPDWVCTLGITEDNKVVLIRQYRHAIGEVCWEIPGGCVDPSDNNFEDAALRELQEETGYTFNEIYSLGTTIPNPAATNNMMHLFIAKGGVKSHKQNLDKNEDIEVALVSIDELIKMLDNEEINEALHITCIYRALRFLGKMEVH